VTRGSTRDIEVWIILLSASVRENPTGFGQLFEPERKRCVKDMHKFNFLHEK